MFHQINELMVLGMHPAIPYPRRSQFRPRKQGEIGTPFNCTAAAGTPLGSEAVQPLAQGAGKADAAIVPRPRRGVRGSGETHQGHQHHCADGEESRFCHIDLISARSYHRALKPEPRTQNRYS